MDDYIGEPVKVVENTYQTRPKDGHRFEPESVTQILREVLGERLEGRRYDAQGSAQLSVQLCDEIRERVKARGYTRYKLVVQATIGEVKGQGVRNASRCLWDTEHDNFASESFQNASLFCTATVFGTYFE